MRLGAAGTEGAEGPATPERPSLLEGGLFLVVVALPLAFTPFTAAPFADPKLVVLVAGALLGVLAGPRIDGWIGIVALAWVAALLLTTVLGLDPWWSTLGAPNQGTGLLALAASAVLLVVATGVPDGLLERLPVWIFWTGVAVSFVAVLGRFVDIGGATWSLGSLSSTLGHRVFVGSFVAAATLSAVSPSLRGAWRLVGLLALGSGLAVTSVRAAWLAVGIGLLYALWRSRRGWRTALAVIVPLGVVMAGWTLADRALPEEGDIGFSAAPRFAQLDEGSASQRVGGWGVYVRAWAEDPVAGSGPATGWGPYLSHATSEEIRITGRDWADAHQLVLELGVTTGSVGVLAFIALSVLVGWRMLHGPRERAWAAGAAVVLGVVHLLQPLNLVLTPLLFLFAGLAAGGARLKTRQPPPWVVVGLAVALLLALARLGASTLERYGRDYASAPALRGALRLEPARLPAAEALAKHLAIDARAGSQAAAREARLLVGNTLSAHPWHPGVRLLAADVEVLLDDRSGARPWLREQLERFPRDPLALGAAAVLALEAGEEERARRLARGALEGDPSLGFARNVLERLEEGDATSAG